MPKLIVIADDFTGSNDTGVQLAKKGATVTVALGEDTVICDVPVINTESRPIEKELAIARVQKAIKTNVTSETRCIFKKIDSTFRGNVGAEVEAAARSFDAKFIVVAAAIPAAGRTTVNGYCMVNGIPVAETEFATDPKTPVSHSHIAEIIGAQSQLPCRTVPLSAIREGLLSAEINQTLLDGHVTVLITDAENDEDLALVAQALERVDEKMILVGAAGIANQLPSTMYRSKNNRLPVLVLAGSMSDVTRKQIDYSKERGLNVIDIDAQKIWFEPEKALDSALEQARTALRAGTDCAIVTAANQHERMRSTQFCKQQCISGTEFGNRVAMFLGNIGKILMAEQSFAGVFFTGGDIATAVAEQLGANGYEIEGEVLPCIPYGHFTGDVNTVVTKAGGFGSKEAIERTIQFLREKQ